MEDIERIDWWEKEIPERPIIKYLREYMLSTRETFTFECKKELLSDRMLALGLSLFAIKKHNG